MVVITPSRPAPTPIEGVSHVTLAGTAEGLQQLSVWQQTMVPGAATPPHSHGCDEAVLCLAGQGEVHTEGRVHRFAAGDTVVLPRDRVHQLFNTGSGPMETLGLFGATPVPTHWPDGRPLELPWRT